MPITTEKQNVLFFFIALLCILLAGCSAVETKQKSSVMDYLYPDQDEHIETPQVPRLSLPLRVGIAFVPETSAFANTDKPGAASRAGQPPTLTERDKIVLMRDVSKHFLKYDFVKSIDMIPTVYLSPQGSFTNLDQIQTMYGIDVIALLSYDQAQFVDQGIASITYWTIVGAYVVPGEKNDTHTMVDATVFDIKSRKMLFRAPGVSHINHLATPVNLSEQLRDDQLEGFEQACADLIVNLDLQLDLFKDRIKEAPEDYIVEYKPGYTGGGSMNGLLVFTLVLMIVCRLWRIKQPTA